MNTNEEKRERARPIDMPEYVHVCGHVHFLFSLFSTAFFLITGKYWDNFPASEKWV